MRKNDNSNPGGDYDGDVFLYYGDISRYGYHEISTLCEGEEGKKPKVCLVLITHGGDPDAAYRIARALNHHYDRVEILIPDICKSAGTLLCIGAHQLIFGDRGELGPLDVQISKPDELYENMSGLDIIQAVNAVGGQMLEAFRTYLVDIRAGSRLRTKMAADIATKLAEGFIAPIAAKLDPVTLGGHQRAMRVGYEYGGRLNEMAESLQPGALQTLVSGFPSHTFVIDRKEAGDLFENVAEPNEMTTHLYDQAREIVEKYPYPMAQPVIIDYLKLSNTEETNDDAKDLDKQNQTNRHNPISNGEPEQESTGNEPVSNQPTAQAKRTNRITKPAG